MDSGNRQRRIVELLRGGERVEVAVLARELDTSEVTVRRDLDALAAQGVLRRVHGGAVGLLPRGEELPFSAREIESSEEKQRIAAVVAGLVRDGEAVVVDSGTGGLAVARALAGRRLTAVPLSLPAAGVLSGSAGTTVILPGGIARPGEGALVGPLTEQSLAALRVDTAVIGCCGLEGGVTAYDLTEAAVKRAAMTAARRTVLIAEAVKFSRSALAVFAAAEAFDVLVTGAEAPAAEVERLERAGVEVHRA